MTRSGRTVILLAGGLALGVGGGYYVYQQRVAKEWRQQVPAPQELAGRHPELRERVARALEAARLSQGDAEAVGELARLYLANGYLAEAEQALVLRVKLEPAAARWHHWLAGLWSSYGRLDEAIPQYEAVRRLDGGYLPAQVRLGEALAKLNRSEEAEQVYQGVLGHEPNHLHAILGLARLAVARENWSDAKTLCERAIQVDGQFSAAWSLLATVEGKLHSPEKAEAARRRAAVLGRFRDIEDPWADELLAECYDSYRLQVAASTLASTGSGRGALAPLIRAVQLWPEDGKAHRQLGRVYLKIREFDAARRSFERARQLLDGDPAVYMDLLDVYRNTQDIRAAAAMAEEGVKRFPESPGLNFEHGMLLVAARRTEEAIPFLEKARRLEPENVEASIKLVPIYFREGRLREGEAVLDEALVREPNNVPLLLMSVRFRTEQGNADLAREHLLRAIEFGASPDASAELSGAFERRFGQSPK